MPGFSDLLSVARYLGEKHRKTKEHVLKTGRNRLDNQYKHTICFPLPEHLGLG